MTTHNDAYRRNRRWRRGATKESGGWLATIGWLVAGLMISLLLFAGAFAAAGIFTEPSQPSATTSGITQTSTSGPTQP